MKVRSVTVATRKRIAITVPQASASGFTRWRSYFLTSPYSTNPNFAIGIPKIR